MTGLLTISRVSAGDIDEIANLNRVVFGPGRFARTAFRVREAADLDLATSMIARNGGGVVVGAVLMTPVVVGGETGLWLGPIAVTEVGRRAGVGAELMRRAIAAAAETGARFVLLVGDLSYYGRFGFTVVPAATIGLPGPVDPARFLGLALTPLPILPRGVVAAG